MALAESDIAARKPRTYARLIMSRMLGVLALCSAVAHASPDLRKPPPDAAAAPYRERFEALVRERYPQLATEPAAGMPVVTVLFEPDGRLARTDLEIRAGPPEMVTASEEQFFRFGHLAGQLRYIGEARIELPANTVLVVFGGLDSRDVDRALVERYFPQIEEYGIPANEGFWILFDHEGHVLQSGQETFNTRSLRSLLEKRYPGIRISDMTLTPVLGRDGRPIKNASGQPLRLHNVWLAAGSPTPDT
jgi:hypothetical protein